MRIDLVFPTLPPVLDGIGDHTALLAQALQRAHCDVRIRTAQTDFSPIPNVPVSVDFTISPPWGIRSLVEAVVADPPDWLFVQFNQFSYGQYGFNPWLPLALSQIKQACPNLRIAWMAHEDFVPVISWRFALMTLWQRWQFRRIGEQADQIFFSIAPWVTQYDSWFPRTPVTHLPVGSNIPRMGTSRSEARQYLGYSPDDFVAGVFGTVNRNARQLDLIADTIHTLREATPHLKVLYVGPHGPVLRDALKRVDLHDAGRLPGEDVSKHLMAMDLHLAPFVDGLSTRRGSAMATLQHGVATLSTSGPLTDQMITEVNGKALVSTPLGNPSAYTQAALDLYHNPDRRAEIAHAGQHFFDAFFDWDAIAHQLLGSLSKAESRSQSLDPTLLTATVPPGPITS